MTKEFCLVLLDVACLSPSVRICLWTIFSELPIKFGSTCTLSKGADTANASDSKQQGSWFMQPAVAKEKVEEEERQEEGQEGLPFVLKVPPSC